MAEPIKTKRGVQILPTGSPVWVRWIVIVAFLGFAIRQPVTGILLAVLVALFMSKGYITWS